MINCENVEAKRPDLLLWHLNIFLEELKRTIRQFSAGIELNTAPTGEEPLKDDFLVTENW
jgi:hypothetical protein